MTGLLVFDGTDDADGGGEVAYAIAPCFVCRGSFNFNPLTVPSILHRGERKPVCARCMDIVNAERIKNGKEPFAVAADAYKATAAEHILASDDY